MSQIALSPPATGTGVFTISAPATNTNQTLTLPDATGTVLTTATAGVPINGPAFSAYGNGQSLSSSVQTKLQLTTEQFDTNNCFDSTTNYRFTPTVAGYYQCNMSLQAGASYTSGNVRLYKNGAFEQVGMDVNASGGSFVGSALVYLNGTTDYIEMYGLFATGQVSVGSGTKFSGFLARSAL